MATLRLLPNVHSHSAHANADVQVNGTPPLTLKAKTIIRPRSVVPFGLMTSVFLLLLAVPTTESESVFVRSQFMNCVGTMKPVINWNVLGREGKDKESQCEKSTFTKLSLFRRILHLARGSTMIADYTFFFF